jgi:integrase/recombinase XerD
MSNPLRVEMSGPLSAFAPGFLEDLFRQGYRPETAAKQLQLMAHLSRWLAGRQLDGSELDSAHLEQFLAERREDHRHFVSAKGTSPLLSYLRGVGVAPVTALTAPRTPSELLIDRYSAYLLERRGLSRSTVRNYANVARDFFAERERNRGELALDELGAAAVNAFVLREARRKHRRDEAHRHPSAFPAPVPARRGRDQPRPYRRRAQGRELAARVACEGLGRRQRRATAAKLRAARLDRPA